MTGRENGEVEGGGRESGRGRVREGDRREREREREKLEFSSEGLTITIDRLFCGCKAEVV